ncbi:hypothetical protein [Halocalculus aciditolerans]|uniref:Uncharacterized protein n=1 Tax=Halocalculus aciditolerans TaxID=1383812 RepID=A0A830F0X6_9EURY|nr:hypothetical protein [Halocalculus aciditolerans]GGL50502.1 hypothetical protein GCM10009039_05880 [Halocalculus aciditolerans]
MRLPAVINAELGLRWAQALLLVALAVVSTLLLTWNLAFVWVAILAAWALGRAYGRRSAYRDVGRAAD